MSGASGPRRSDSGDRWAAWAPGAYAIRECASVPKARLGCRVRGTHDWACALDAGRCVAGTPPRSGPAPRRRRGGRSRRTARPSGDGLCAARRRTAGHRALRDTHPAGRVLPVGPVAVTFVLGPDSAVSPLVAAAIIPLAVPGDASTRIALAGMLAILVGAIMLAGGIAQVLRLRHRAAVDAGAPRLPDGHCHDGGGGAAPEALGFWMDSESFLLGVRNFVTGLDETNPTAPPDRCYLARADPHPAAGGAEDTEHLGGRRRDSAGGRARACGRGAGRRRCYKQLPTGNFFFFFFFFFFAFFFFFRSACCTVHGGPGMDGWVRSATCKRLEDDDRRGAEEPRHGQLEWKQDRHHCRQRPHTGAIRATPARPTARRIATRHGRKFRWIRAERKTPRQSALARIERAKFPRDRQANVQHQNRQHHRLAGFEFEREHDDRVEGTRPAAR